MVSRSLVPWFAIVLALLIGVTGLAHQASQNTILIPIRKVYGVAPSHLLDGAFWNVLLSVFHTNDPFHLGSAFVMTILCVGWYEQQAGWRRSLLAFSVGHVGACIVTTIVIGAAHFLLNNASTLTLWISPDVGPSAGYYGCLGAACFHEKSNWRNWLFRTVLFFLVIRLVLSLFATGAEAHVIQSDLAHGVALGLGGMLGLKMSKGN